MKRWLKVGDRGCDALRKIGGNPTYKKMGGGRPGADQTNISGGGHLSDRKKYFAGPPQKKKNKQKQ